MSPAWREPTERFWEKVDFSASCWVWTGAVQPKGYGAFGLATGKVVRAHRFAWETLCGPIPEGLHIDHLCKNPPCVNPDHLEPVTPGENVRRSSAGARESARTHCPHGHAYDEANTYLRNGRRNCRACRNEHGRRRRARLASIARDIREERAS